MTYISPRVAIWGAFCAHHYIRYIIIVAHGKSCALHAYAYTYAVAAGAYTGRPLLPSRAGSSRLCSLRSPLVLLLLLLLVVVVVVILVYSPSPFLSRSIARGVLRALFSAHLLLLLAFRSVPSGVPSDVPGFLRHYRESFRVRLRAADYRNQATPGSGISNANYNHRFRPYVTSLFSCDDRARSCIRMYIRVYVRTLRGCTTERGGPAASAAPRENLSFGSLHP